MALRIWYWQPTRSAWELQDAVPRAWVQRQGTQWLARVELDGIAVTPRAFPCRTQAMDWVESAGRQPIPTAARVPVPLRVPGGLAALRSRGAALFRRLRPHQAP